MALVKLYRVAYIVGTDDDVRIYFSRWTQSQGTDEILAELGRVNTPPLNMPTVLGWETKELDTEPS